jgi:hypothetical protein
MNRNDRVDWGDYRRRKKGLVVRNDAHEVTVSGPRAVPNHPGEPGDRALPLLYHCLQASSLMATWLLSVCKARPNRVRLRDGSRNRIVGIAVQRGPQFRRVPPVLRQKLIRDETWCDSSSSQGENGA